MRIYGSVAVITPRHITEFVACMKGPGCHTCELVNCWPTMQINDELSNACEVIVNVEELPIRCLDYDYKGDLDVDLRDLATLQRLWGRW